MIMDDFGEPYTLAFASGKTAGVILKNLTSKISSALNLYLHGKH